MTTFRLHLRLFSMLLLAAAIVPEARADIDKKFYDKAAAIVWSADLPQFDPDADLSAPVYSDKAAVYIARYRKINALHDESTNATKELMTGFRNSNAINAVELDRTMVKIIDRSAIDDFSSFTVPVPKKVDIHDLTVLSIKPAFGARLIKPDGTVENIDMSEALTVTGGKKDKDEEYKIAIPGLEPGVILDYFYYMEYFLEEQSLPAMDFEFFRSYPTKDYMVDITVAPTLAFEFAAYNGAPDFTLADTDNGLNHLTLHLTDMDAIEQSVPYFSKARQMPYINVHILNNTGRLAYVPKSARGGGVRAVLYPQLLNDIGCSIKDTKYPDKIIGDAESIMKQWKKNHPQASEREMVDAAYVAMIFSCMKNEEKISDKQFAKSFSRLLEKLSTTLPGRVAVTSSRNAAPVDKLVYFGDASYFVTVGDSCYFPPVNNRFLHLPGDIPDGFDSEKAFKFEGAPYRDNLHTVAQPFTLPRSKAMDNIIDTVSEISIEADNTEFASVTSTVNLSGAVKSMLTTAIHIDKVMAELARFLGQKEPKRRSVYSAEDEAAMQREILVSHSKMIWNTDDPKLISFSIPSIGCTPDKPTTTLSISGLVPDMVSHAGNDLLVNIGKLIWRQTEIKGSARERDISVVQDFAFQQRNTLKFTVPDGYEVIPESVTALNRMISSPVACFVVNATAEGNEVVVQVLERHSVALAPASAWPEILKVLDAAFEFNSATIALRPV